jgi:hypothetical protein
MKTLVFWNVFAVSFGNMLLDVLKDLAGLKGQSVQKL